MDEKKLRKLENLMKGIEENPEVLEMVKEKYRLQRKEEKKIASAEKTERKLAEFRKHWGMAKLTVDPASVGIKYNPDMPKNSKYSGVAYAYTVKLDGTTARSREVAAAVKGSGLYLLENDVVFIVNHKNSGRSIFKLFPETEERVYAQVK